jgi:F-type H+-transporting ATPase subunit b
MHRSLRLAALLTLLLATPAFAAEGGLLDVNTGLMVWTILIFLIVLVVLYKFAYPHILGAVEAREERIRELLDQAARDRDEARALLAEQKRELEEVRTRAQELVAEGRTAGERLREEILAEARAEREALIARTQREVQQQVDRAMGQLRADAAELAIAAAERLLVRRLDADDNRRLVREYLDEIQASGPATVAAGV